MCSASPPYEARDSDITRQFEFRSPRRENRSDIAYWRLTEETTVFAIELRRAFVADLECSGGRIQAIVQQEVPRRLKPELLLVLKRTHRSQRAETVVQSGNSQVRNFREFFNTQRLGIVRDDQCNRFRCAVALISERCHCAQARSRTSPEDSVDNFALDQAAQKRNVLRPLQQIQQAAACVQKFRCCLADRHSRAARQGLLDMNFLASEQLSRSEEHTSELQSPVHLVCR